MIAGANPLYFLDTTETQEEQNAPLAATVDWLQNSFPIEGNIVHIIASTEGTYSVYFVTDTTHVYAATQTSFQDLGYPTNNLINDNGGRLACIAGYLVFSLSTLPNLYKVTMPNAIWSTFSLDEVSKVSGIHFLEPFLDFLAVTDGNFQFNTSGSTGAALAGDSVTGSSGGIGQVVAWDDTNKIITIMPFSGTFNVTDTITYGVSSYTATLGTQLGTTNQLIRKADPTSFLISQGIDIGQGWGVIGLKNYNNKYLAIAAGQTLVTSVVSGYVQNYLFLWDGVSARYNYSIKIPGKYIDMKVVDSVLYVAVLLSSGKTRIYFLNGTVLKRYKTPQIRLISSNPAPVPNPLFDYKGNLGVHLRSSLLNPTDPVSDPLAVYGNEELGEFAFIHSYGRPFEAFSIGFDGQLYATIPKNGATEAQLWVYSDNNNVYQNINYRSLWIPVRNLQFLDIYYEKPPQNNGDAINTTIEGKGEDVPNNYQLINLNQITNLIEGYQLPNKTRLDCKGFTGDQLRITISTENTSWQPIIRKIVPIDNS